MKWLIYLLLIINVSVIAWYYQPDSGTSRPSHAPGSRLVLLEEYQQKLAEQGKKESDSVRSWDCYTLGPFTSRKASTQELQRLVELGLDARLRVSREKLRDGYWVMLPDSQATKQTLSKLKKVGFTEYFMILKGEYKGAISLGLFSRPDLAQRRLVDVSKKGFSPQVEKVSLPKTEYWLDWPTSAAQTIPEHVLTELREAYEGIGKSERRCQERTDKD